MLYPKYSQKIYDLTYWDFKYKCRFGVNNKDRIDFIQPFVQKPTFIGLFIV